MDQGLNDGGIVQRAALPLSELSSPGDIAVETVANHAAESSGAPNSKDSPVPFAEHHNEAALSLAIKSLSATKIRTGERARRADLHRVISKYALSPIDAAELETRAERADLLAPDEEMDIDASASYEEDAVSLLLDDAKQYRLLRPDEHSALSRAIKIGNAASGELAAGCPDEIVRTRLERLAEDGRRAKDRFVASNIRLVVSVAKGYMHRGLDFADLIQEGSFGLIRAVELYDPAEGARFSTYAHYWIVQSIMRAIADKSRLIRLPVHAHDELNRIRRTQRELDRRFGREPTPREVAEHLGVGVEKVIALSQWLAQPLSLSSPIGEDGESELGDFVQSREPPLDDLVAEKQRDAALDSMLKEVLTTRQADVVRKRFGIHGGRPMTLEQIGLQYGVTRERIRQIESKALKILRNRIHKYKVLDGAE